MANEECDKNSTTAIKDISMNIEMPDFTQISQESFEGAIAKQILEVRFGLMVCQLEGQSIEATIVEMKYPDVCKQINNARQFLTVAQNNPSLVVEQRTKVFNVLMELQIVPRVFNQLYELLLDITKQSMPLVCIDKQAIFAPRSCGQKSVSPPASTLEQWFRENKKVEIEKDELLMLQSIGRSIGQECACVCDALQAIRITQQVQEQLAKEIAKVEMSDIKIGDAEINSAEIEDILLPGEGVVSVTLLQALSL